MSFLTIRGDQFLGSEEGSCSTAMQHSLHMAAAVRARKKSVPVLYPFSVRFRGVHCGCMGFWLRRAKTKKPIATTQVAMGKLVAGAGFEPATFRL